MTIGVLLVEDNADQASTIGHAFDVHCAGQFAVTAVVTLKEAVAFAGLQTFDVALLDLLLPDSKGIGTLTAFRAAFPTLPVFVLSCADESVYGPECIKAGAVAYFDKLAVNLWGLIKMVEIVANDATLRAENLNLEDELKKVKLEYESLKLAGAATGQRIQQAKEVINP